MFYWSAPGSFFSLFVFYWSGSFFPQLWYEINVTCLFNWWTNLVLNCKKKKKKPFCFWIKKRKKEKPFCFIIGCKLSKNCPFSPCFASLVYSFYLQSTKHSPFWCVCMSACALPEQTTLQSTAMSHYASRFVRGNFYWKVVVGIWFDIILQLTRIAIVFV